MFFKVFTVLTSAFIISGCAANIQKYGEIDNNNKTITVPAGSKGLKGKIKKTLLDNGWKMSVYRGPKITEGAIGENIRLENYDTYNTRYTLNLNSYAYDFCLNFSPAITYEIYIIDNKTGSEVITMDGRGCESSVAQEFIEALKGQKK